MAKRDIYIAIMVAAAKGRCVFLSVEEVRDLSNDDAIMTRAANALDASEFADGHPGWEKINPRRDRSNIEGNLAT